MALEKELQKFRELLPTLADHIGEFAVIVDEVFVGSYSTWEDACKVGYQKAGIGKPFLVKKIEEVETVNLFTRDIGACHATAMDTLIAFHTEYKA